MKRRGALLVAGAVIAAPVCAYASMTIDALSKVERGRWQVRDLNQATAPAALCLGDPVQLVQFEHREAPCPSEVTGRTANAASVQYSCPGRGFGHSQVRVETPRLIRVDTQGVSNGRPFSYRLEARRVGNCG
jgi:hypothetical protein